ncbi:MAG: serine protease [Lachnospiraceae bacterium]|nr:serine protease [Lachnospiraceae bacterium]
MAGSPNEKKFMREKIVKPPINKRRVAGRLLCLLLVAAVFGVVAAVTFAVSRPLAEKYFGSETASAGIPITIAKDAEPGAQTAPMETMKETAEEALQPDELREEIQEIVEEELKEFIWTPEQIAGAQRVMQEICQEADKGIVTVAAVRRQVDWFDNPVESAGQYAGVIVAINPSEAVILTGEQAVQEADALNVIFGDGNIAPGEIKQRDTVAHLAAIRVKTADITDSTMNWIKAVELGNSYTVRVGDPVLAVGSPSGRVHSVGQGLISYVARNVQVADGQTRVLYTDFDCDVEKGTFLLNLSGQLIGWATEQFKNDETPDVTMIMPVSEYKGILQKMTNGEEIPYVGIMGLDVSESMQAGGIPLGIYITDCIAEGPAYSAGIQNGDILTGVNGETVASIREFQSRLEDKKAGDTLNLTVRRKGIDAYKEIEYSITIGAR